MFEKMKSTLACEFSNYFNYAPVDFYVSPGRLEIIGNHTDHNGGVALVASASIYSKGAVKRSNNNLIRLFSEGYGLTEIEVKSYEPDSSLFSTTESLIKGILSGFIKRGFKVGGFDAFIQSDVISGSGISSSASFEMLISTILNDLYNENSIDKMTLVHISQEAERDYFGKPCGLLDQIGSAFGGLSYVDFKDQNNPVVINTDFPFDLKILLTNPGGSHAGLDSYYAAIPSDMKSVAKKFNKKYLCEVDENEFNNNIDALEPRCANRAKHFFSECKRVKKALSAIENKDECMFLSQINESGFSSSFVLENTLVPERFENSPEKALQMARIILPFAGHRVHGGGFMGTIISFVKEKDVDLIKNEMEKIFGENSVILTSISPIGSTKI